LTGTRFLTVAIALLFAGGATASSLADVSAGASCIIEPNHIYKLAMPTPGAIESVEVERSDKVKKGQVIAELESGVEQSQIEAARVRASTDVFIRLKQAIYDAAASKLERQRTLRANLVVSQQTLEDAQSAVAVARADREQAELDRKLAGFEVARLQATLKRRTLKSPADGVVTAVDLLAGEYADPASPIVTVTEVDPLKVDVYLPASAYEQVKVGARALVTPRETAIGAREAVITVKDPQIDASSGLFLVELRLPNPDGAIPAGIRCGFEFVP
jgi:RND family efflux transporter MFP subunit